MSGKQEQKTAVRTDQLADWARLRGKTALIWFASVLPDNGEAEEEAANE